MKCDISELTGTDQLLLIAGPCVLESYETAASVAEGIIEAVSKTDLDVKYIFKSSFDKANRTSITSYRGPGIDEGLRVLDKIKSTYDVPITTDIHETYQAKLAAEVADLIQIPAFLCRQTDLLVAAGKTGRPVNIKKGQFMSPESMRYAVEKVKTVSDQLVTVTERGTTYGRGDLVVDYRGLVEMSAFAPVIFDASHSIQRPSSGKRQSGGNRDFLIPLACAAAATGQTSGLFVEVHENPKNALCDSQSQWPLNRFEELLSRYAQHFNSPTTNEQSHTI